MTTQIDTPSGLSYLKGLMEQCDQGRMFDLHDAYGVGVRQAVAALLPIVDQLGTDGLDAIQLQFQSQGRISDMLIVVVPGSAHRVYETPMCIAHDTADILIQQGVECGRLLILAALVDSYVATPRRLTAMDVHEVAMHAYAWLMGLAANQLADDEYEIWYNTWCQIEGKSPWELSQYGYAEATNMASIKFPV